MRGKARADESTASGGQVSRRSTLGWQTTGCSGRSAARPAAEPERSLGSRRTVVDWLEPWHPISAEPDNVAAMERELRREVSDGHELHGLPVRALARRQDRDDVLFAFYDGSGRVAVVHLTWASIPPERPPWPHTTMFPTLEAWRVEGMCADHDEFRDD
jgi:hypothetical protein